MSQRNTTKAEEALHSGRAAVLASNIFSSLTDDTFNKVNGKIDLSEKTSDCVIATVDLDTTVDIHRGSLKTQLDTIEHMDDSVYYEMLVYTKDHVPDLEFHINMEK